MIMLICILKCSDHLTLHFVKGFNDSASIGTAKDDTPTKKSVFSISRIKLRYVDEYLKVGDAQLMVTLPTPYHTIHTYNAYLPTYLPTCHQVSGHKG